MASDLTLNVGEALVGEGNEIAHIDLLIGSKSGPVGTAFANALARQSATAGTSLAVATRLTPVNPAPLLSTSKLLRRGALKQAPPCAA